VVAAAAAALTGAAAAYLAVRKAGAAAAAPTPVSSATRSSRNLQLARLGGSAAAGAAVHQVKRALASDDKREALDAAFQLRTAEQVAEALGNMKGALMKIGQMASYLDQGLPEPVREALAELQANAPPMAAALARATVEESLGRPITELYAEWDDLPLAAASIGQVHRAVTKDGRSVAVKVQYPGVGEAIRADLDNAGVIFAAMGMLFPGLEPGPIVAEIRERLTEELDYRLEAENQAYFADAYRDHPFIHVPDVVPELCGDRVLTTELADGVPFSVAETWPQEERDLAGETIYRFVFGSFYNLLAFNGDPHPGNYLFHPGGRVTFLDFGLVKHFEQRDADVLGAMVRASLAGDAAAFRDGLTDSGFLPEHERFSDDDLHGYFGHFYDFVRDDEVRTITPEWSSESVRRFFDSSGEFGEIMRAANVPPAYVIIQRINLGLYAVLGELHATANWHRIAEELWPWTKAAPSTPLGAAHAEWAARR
jgi:predicted unusual protein kinase regulating ubiquinone biosynthesis (AarF/ABC1/UbiB family)